MTNLRALRPSRKPPAAGDDFAFGLAWHLVHFAETAPGWPLHDALDDPSPWVALLRERAARSRP